MYWQYGRTHYIRAHRLRCTASTADGTRGRVNGGGSDDVGKFVLSGTYEGLRLVLAKKYIAGTGDAKENKGHAMAVPRSEFVSKLRLAARGCPGHIHTFVCHDERSVQRRRPI